MLRVEVGAASEDIPLLDHQVRLIQAAGADEAYAKALSLGAEAAHTYRNAAGESVRWHFAGLAELDVVAAESLTDGVEVYSWRSSATPASVVLPKEQLAVFRSQVDGGRTASELLAWESRAWWLTFR